MKAYFVQLVNRRLCRNNIMLSGAVLAKNKEDAKIKAIAIAKEYQAVRERNIELSVYTLIELTEENIVEFAVHR